MTQTVQPGTVPEKLRLGPLAVYGYYRILLSTALLLIFLARQDHTEQLGGYRPDLYLLVSVGYFVVALASSLFIRHISSRERMQGAILIAIDIIALTLLAHASGGAAGAVVAPLLVVTVAAGAILLPGRISLVVASAATLIMFYEQFYLALESGLPLTTGSTQVGLLGLALFGIALATNQMTRRLQASEALANRRSQEITELEHLNAHIIQRMRTGILVVDSAGTIKLANSAGQQMLQKNAWQPNARLDDVSPALAQRIRDWRRDNEQRFPPLRSHEDNPEMATNMTQIRLGEERATLVFLENMTALAQHLQQIKLAALGRLTASIAHEIRNPLSAINHAAQLLDESSALGTEDHRLAEIIQQQALRLDHIVENVLKLSRRQVPRNDLLELSTWLQQFRRDYLAVHPRQEPPDDIDIQVPAPRIKIRFDPQHLHQILQNLCDNGLRHGRKFTGAGRVVLKAGINETTELPFLQIHDNGPGIPAQNAAHLFEPFFTTEAGGTGLGLYIARELCEANHAHLAHVSADTGNAGMVFRITFAHPGRIAG